MPLRACYTLSGFLHNVLSLLVGKAGSWGKNLQHFIHLINNDNLVDLDLMVSFDIVSFLSEIFQWVKLRRLLRTKAQEGKSLGERFVLQVDAIIELVVCLKTSCFKAGDKFSQQKEGMAMESSLSSGVCNILVGHFEHMAITSAGTLRYMAIASLFGNVA